MFTCSHRILKCLDKSFGKTIRRRVVWCTLDMLWSCQTPAWDCKERGESLFRGSTRHDDHFRPVPWWRTFFLGMVQRNRCEYVSLEWLAIAIQCNWWIRFVRVYMTWLASQSLGQVHSTSSNSLNARMLSTCCWSVLGTITRIPQSDSIEIFDLFCCRMVWGHLEYDSAIHLSCISVLC